MDLLIYIAIGLVFFYFLFKRNARKGKQIPGPKAWPLIGNLFELNKGATHEVLANLAERYGEIFQVTAFGQTFVVLNTAAMVRSALCKDPYIKAMSDRTETFYGEMVLYGSQSVGLIPKAYGPLHGELKKVYTRGLHVYGDGHRAFVSLLELELKKLHSRIDDFNGIDFDMVAVLKRSMNNMLSILLIGQDHKEDDEDFNMFFGIEKGANFFIRSDNDTVLRKMPSLRFLPGLYKERFNDLMHARDSVVRRLFRDTKATYEEGKIRGLVDYFINQQIQDQNQDKPVLLKDEVIMATVVETVDAVMLTISTSLISTFLCLLNHPNYQTLIQKDLDRVIGTDRTPHLSDRKDCVISEAVMMEVQRYATVFVPGLPRFCEPNIEFEGFDIPAKSEIIPNVYYIHHDEKVWGDPWTFRPERWLDESDGLIPSDHPLRKSWLPFGTGRRQCLGETFARNVMFLYMSTLLQHRTFVASSEHAVSCDPRDGPFEVNLTCAPTSYMCKAVPRTT